MLSREDCLRRAQNCERFAEGAFTEATRAEYKQLAASWRKLAADMENASIITNQKT